MHPPLHFYCNITACRMSVAVSAEAKEFPLGFPISAFRSDCIAMDFSGPEDIEDAQMADITAQLRAGTANQEWRTMNRISRELQWAYREDFFNSLHDNVIGKEWDSTEEGEKYLENIVKRYAYQRLSCVPAFSRDHLDHRQDNRTIWNIFANFQLQVLQALQDGISDDTSESHRYFLLHCSLVTIPRIFERYENFANHRIRMNFTCDGM